MSKDNDELKPIRIRIRIVIGVLLCAIIGSVLLFNADINAWIEARLTEPAPLVSANFAIQQKIAESAMIHCETYSPDSLQCFDAQKELDRLSAMADTSAEYVISALLEKKRHDFVMAAIVGHESKKSPHIIVHEPGWEPPHSSHGRNRH